MEKNRFSSGDYHLAFYSGHNAAMLLPCVWGEIDPRVKKYIVWSRPNAQKEIALYEQWSKADFVCLAYDSDERFVASAWIDTAQIGNKEYKFAHFFFNGSAIDSVSCQFWQAVDALRPYKEIFALIPLKYRWARKHARKFGFEYVQKLKSSIIMDGFDDLQDAELLRRAV